MSERGGNTTNGRPLKPTLAANRNVKSPITPRLAGSATIPGPPNGAKRTPGVHSETPPVASSLKNDGTPSKDALSIGNITPRSSARRSRADITATTPESSDSPLAPRIRQTIATPGVTAEKAGSAVGLGSNGSTLSSRSKPGRPKSVMSDNGSRASSPLVMRSPGFTGTSQLKQDESIDSRFFHASDVTKQEPAPKRPDPKKTASFFHADGKEEGNSPTRKTASPRAASPVLSAVSEKRSPAPWLRSSKPSNPSRSPPMLSPALSSASNNVPTDSPYFAAATGQRKNGRSPSPSKENIHLSYRKGASQIFGTRPATMAALREPEATPSVPVSSLPFRRASLDRKNGTPNHGKSPSLSSIDSGNSPQTRRRSATTVEIAANTPSPLGPQITRTNSGKSATHPRPSLTRPELATITSYQDRAPNADVQDTPASPHTRRFSTSSSVPMSPSKHSAAQDRADAAATARRERKVLDLEISNSSLLAINSSLEREVRRQKSELKRFRRLSRAGRIPGEGMKRSARFSEGLSVVGESADEEDGTDGEGGVDFGPPSGFTDVYDDFSASGSDDDDGSSLTSPSSISNTNGGQEHRLAKDEQRLKVDLAKHKDLLVQSQMMNQSLKRCLYTTEVMIEEGRKSLAYHVQTGDVNIGGRVLPQEGGEDDGDGDDDGDVDVDETEDWDAGVGDDTVRAAEDPAAGFLSVWKGLGSGTRVPTSSDGGGTEDTEAGGDRDSGIEVDKPPPRHVAFAEQGAPSLGLGRPPEEVRGLRSGP